VTDSAVVAIVRTLPNVEGTAEQMNVSTLVFLGLAVVWAIVLLPEAARKLSGVRSSDTIRSFNQQLAVLDRSGRRRSAERGMTPSSSNVIDLGSRGRVPAAPAGRPVPYSVRRRRQEVLTVLAAAAVLTLLCTVAFGGPFLYVHLLADVLLVAYVVALARVSQAPAARPVHRGATHLGPALATDRLHSATVRRTMPAQARRIAN
jgi:hypothetical protein